MRTGEHEVIYNIEQKVLKEVRKMGYKNPPYSFGGSSETFVGLEKSVVLEIINDKIVDL